MNLQIPKNFVAKPFNYHEEVELLITAITNLGFGIGRIDNWVIMVPFVYIGELVKAKIFKNHKNYSEADLVKILEPSSKRVYPSCELFGICGGCQYQHIAYAEQLKLKREHVKEVLLKLGGLNVEVNECIHSEHEYKYRSKITPHFQKFKENQPFNIGFLAHGCHQKIVDVKKCAIATDAINIELNNVRDHIQSLAKTKKRGGTLLLRDTTNGVISDNNAKISQKIGDFTFKFKAGSFFQNNPYTLPKMIDFVTKSSLGCKFLVDAYCGVGVFGICSAEHFKNVYGVEIDKEAISFAHENAHINDIKNITFIAGDATSIFGNISFPSGDTCVLIDPPRAGCDASFINQLLSFEPKKIVYISCAPDTQARDLRILVEKYSIVTVQPIDLFPQTRHIENVVVLIKKS